VFLPGGVNLTAKKDPYLAATFDKYRATKVMLLRSNLSVTDAQISINHQSPRQLPLNDKQQQAATCPPTIPLSIRAGAGSGKTHTMVQRALFLSTECGLNPEEIFLSHSRKRLPMN
jgi:hypothetical protein